MFWHAGAYEDHRLAIAGMSQCSESGAPKAGFAQLGRSGPSERRWCEALRAGIEYYWRVLKRPELLRAKLTTE